MSFSHEPLWLAADEGVVRLSSVDAFIVRDDKLVALLRSGKEVVVTSSKGWENLEWLMDELGFKQPSVWLYTT
ncbi:hypothetical protein QTP99_10500 [Caldanaerobacter subterraneus KAk]|uniref:hypothetical protein n=1 Tax=Caldanaerobacter subterraneus TaxID=911092 RepID=UPI0032C01736